MEIINRLNNESYFLVEVEIEREKLQLKTEYEEKIRQLQKEVEKEQESNAKATTEMENLRRAYQDDLQKINNSSKKVLNAYHIHFYLKS